MSLVSRLQRILPPLENPPVPIRATESLDSILQGRVAHTPYGDCFLVEKQFALDARHGSLLLRHAYNALYSNFSLLGQSLPEPLRLEQAIFLDTETTGLAGGTGTYAFLVGLAYFKADYFVVKQLLMRDYDEECALLYLLQRELEKRAIIISFNGKAFDIPLLETRFLLAGNGLPGPKAKIQLDLLYMARKIWRRQLSSCSLSSLEINILGVRRQGDIAGADIPARYFDFLRSGDGHLLIDVFKHNVVDIVSMLALLYRLNLLGLQEPQDCRCPWEAEALADLALKAELPNRGLAYLEIALDLCQKRDQRTRLLCTKALTLKRLQRHEEAAAFWQNVIEVDVKNFNAYEELAKHYEHRQRDLLAAERITRRALALAWQSKSAPMAALEHRLGRLERKLRRKTKQ